MLINSYQQWIRTNHSFRSAIKASHTSLATSSSYLNSKCKSTSNLSQFSTKDTRCSLSSSLSNKCRCSSSSNPSKCPCSNTNSWQIKTNSSNRCNSPSQVRYSWCSKITWLSSKLHICTKASNSRYRCISNSWCTAMLRPLTRYCRCCKDKIGEGETT